MRDMFIEEPRIQNCRIGYGDRWAYPITAIPDSDPMTKTSLLKAFLELSNVDRIPTIQEGLDDFDR